MFDVGDFGRYSLRTLALTCLSGLLTLGACAQGSISTFSSAALFSGTSYAGGAIDGNSAIGNSDLVLTGHGFTNNAGQQMFATIVDATSQRLLTQQAGFSVIDAGGNFQLSWRNLVVPGQDLYIAYYADVDKNAFCNTIPTDSGWEVRLRTLDDGTVVAVTPDIAQRSVCELFGIYGLSFDGANAMSGHGYPGHNAYAAVVDLFDKSQVGEVQAAQISSSGEVALSWPGLLVDHHRYVTALCVDLANNGTCDSSAKYTFQTDPVSFDVTVRFVGATSTSSRTFDSYWPQNVVLPPPTVGAVPTLGGP